MRADTGHRRRAGRAVLALLAGLVVGGWAGFGLTFLLKRSQLRDPNAVADVNLPAADELKLVPADAAGFVHVRLADLWRADAMAEFRKVVEKAGPDALKALDESFVPAPSTLDRATLVFLRPGIRTNPPGDPLGFGGPGMPFNVAGPDTPLAVILAFSAPVDQDKFRAANLPRADKLTVGGKAYWFDKFTDRGVYFDSDRVMVVSNGPGLAALLSAPAKSDGPLAPALKLAAAGGRHLVGGLNLAAVGGLPADLRRELPAEVAPILKADAVAVGMVLGAGSRFDLRASYKTEAAAAEAETAARAAAKTGREKLAEAKKRMEEAVKGRPGQPAVRPAEQLPEAVAGVFGLGALNMLDEWLAELPLKREGTELTTSVTTSSLGGAYLSLSAASVGMLLPAVQKVREAAARVQDSNNLKQIGLAFHSYHDVMGKMPSAVSAQPVADPKGRKLLSWRVALLPYLEQDTLFKQFKLDEPWDSEHNKALIPLMPKVYQVPDAPPGEPGTTSYKVFVGPKAPFDADGKKPMRMASFLDGLSNTILVAEGGDPVIWTKPDDFPFDPAKPLPDLSLTGKRVINVLMADGSVRTLNLDAVPEKTLKLLIQPDDGQPVPGDW